jgi:hypothetical protein
MVKVVSYLTVLFCRAVENVGNVNDTEFPHVTLIVYTLFHCMLQVPRSSYDFVYIKILTEIMDGVLRQKLWMVGSVFSMETVFSKVF